MAVIEVCDICRKEVSEENGIILECSDMEGLQFVGFFPVRTKREYKTRICDRCKENIIKYCKKNAR